MMLLKCILLSFVPWIIVGDDGIDDIQKFQKLFMSKRIEQLTAVKNILKLDESKRKVLLDQITSKLFQVNQNSSKLIHRNNHTFTFFFQVLSSGRVDLENLGFVAGLTPFSPGSTMEKVSLVLENTCLASDLLMRCCYEYYSNAKPTAAIIIYIINPIKSGNLLLKWSMMVLCS